MGEVRQAAADNSGGGMGAGRGCRTGEARAEDLLPCHAVHPLDCVVYHLCDELDTAQHARQQAGRGSWPQPLQQVAQRCDWAAGDC